MKTLIAMLLLTATAQAEVFEFIHNYEPGDECAGTPEYCQDFDYNWTYDDDSRELELLSWSNGGKYDFEPGTWTLEQHDRGGLRWVDGVYGFVLTHPRVDRGYLNLTDKVTGITDRVLATTFPWGHDPERPERASYAFSIHRTGAAFGDHERLAGPKSPSFRVGSSFFYQQVPEPSSWLLIAIGGAGVFLRRI